ncbi:MAG TPA: amidohydrolase family protein [Candidatus Methylomirabilis sp.]|nr:amidohydrolase family protein [Candidatus Methylomirabilis sp.]
MFTLLRGGHVFDPEDRGPRDVLICADTIVAVASAIDTSALPAPVAIEDVSSHRVVPGFVDGHVHLLGGGGAEGFDSRLPELWLSDLARSGITTAVGAPGVDTSSKRPEALLAKAYALEREGLSTYVYAGGFVRPWPTITSSAVGDVYAIPKVLGVKVALGEHRASRYADEELIELAAQLHWASGLTGKACVFHAHLGLRRAPAEQLTAVIARSDVPPGRFVATHVNYGPETLAAAPAIARLGAWIDATSVLGPWSAARESVKASVAIRRFLDEGVPVERISLSSDANASVPRRDAAGVREPYWTKIETLPGAIRDLVSEEGLGLPDALRLVTLHPARALGLEARKGSLAPGKDADIVVMDGDLRIRRVYARGRCLVADGQPVVRGMFEERITRAT